MIRKPIKAGSFYPATKEECIEQIEKAISRSFPSITLPLHIVGGIVPHAGWVYSGGTAGLVFKAIKEREKPNTFVMFSSVHVYGVNVPVMMAKGEWLTPMGSIEIDTNLADVVAKEAGALIELSPQPHLGEHSIEVQIPFISYLFPESKIVPIMCPTDLDSIEIGRIIGNIVKTLPQGEVIIIGSSDLTHYGDFYYFSPKGRGEKALQWVKEVNDRRIIELMLNLKPEEVIGEVNKNHNACGGGAIAATLAAVKELGIKKGVLLEYTTSYDVMPWGEPGSFVGYAGVIF